jgi:hypothetical protein
MTLDSMAAGPIPKEFLRIMIPLSVFSWLRPCGAGFFGAIMCDASQENPSHRDKLQNPGFFVEPLAGFARPMRDGH